LFPIIHESRNFVTVHKRLTLGNILSQINSVHILTSYRFKDVFTYSPPIYCWVSHVLPFFAPDFLQRFYMYFSRGSRAPHTVLDSIIPETSGDEYKR
jgi:hypothetical protein